MNPFSASAVGNLPVQEFTTSHGKTRAINVSGLAPSFPSNDLLSKYNFKVVVGSWRRLNYAKTDTNDYEVNVSTYAPRQPQITRAQLVDVDIPNTQLLIEDAWSRIYFSMGARTSPECRSLTLAYSGGSCAGPQTATVVLPLSLDAITSISVVQPGLVRVYLKHKAPTPIVPLAAAWEAFNKPLIIAGLPAGPFSLSASQVHDDSALSFLVMSAELAAAVAALPSTAPALFLTAMPLPGPSVLARVLTRAMGSALGGSPWQFFLGYSPVADTFELQVRAPAPGRLGLEGPLAEYMGFGSSYVWDSAKPLTHPKPGQRFQAGPCYAALETGNPADAQALANRVQNAFDAFVWQPFSFGIGFPGFGPGLLPDVSIPGGCMTLASLAACITAQLATFATVNSTPIVVCTLTYPEATYPGLLFATPTSMALFSLDWTVDTVFQPRRVGFDRQVYPPLDAHAATRPAQHIPQLPAVCGPSCCSEVSYSLPPCQIRATYRPDTTQLVLQSIPLPCFVAILSPPVLQPNVFIMTTKDEWRHGLAVGASIVFSFVDGGGTYRQVDALVVEVPTLTTATIALVSSDPVLLVQIGIIVGIDISCCPAETCAFTLYLQRNNLDASSCTTETSRSLATVCAQGYMPLMVHGRTVDPEVFGFDALTYESCYDLLVSPGSLRTCQDSYILVCLAFSAGDSIPCAGDVYYPSHADGSSTIVFAKVLRSNFLRSDFERVFDYHFNGTGIHLGYIRVRILNPNGTLYQTHGHSISITLRFESYTTSVEFGGGHVVMPNDEGKANFAPLARGTLMPGLGI
jgi:hypothetical protein